MKAITGFIIILSIIAIVVSCSDSCSISEGKQLELDEKFTEAIACYKSLIPSKDSVAAYERLSVVYGRDGDYEGAISFGNRVLISDPSNLRNKLNLGDWYFKTNQADKALNIYLMVERADSLYPELNYNLAVVYLTAFSAPKMARKHIEREVMNHGYTEANLALMGQIFFQLNLYEKAEIAYSRVISENETNATYYFQRAILYYYWDKYLEAISDIDKALILDPKFTDAMLLKIDIGIEINASFVCDLISQVENYSTLPESLLETKTKCLDK